MTWYKMKLLQEIKGKVHYKYHWNLTDEIVKIKNSKEQFKVKILKNESEGEIDFSNFYYWKIIIKN